MNKTNLLIAFIFMIALTCAGCTNNKPVTESSGKTEISEITEIPLKTAEPEEPLCYDDVYDDTYCEDVVLWDKCSVACWDGISHDFEINVNPFDSGTHYEYGPGSGYDVNDSELENIRDNNREYLTEEKEYTDCEGNTYDALYFFKNNNAYVLYESEEDEGFTEIKIVMKVNLRNRMIWDEIDYSFEEPYVVKVPFPVCVEIDYYGIRKYWSRGENWEKKVLFSHCTFEEAKEFYDMFSKDVAVIDDKNKIIKVQGRLAGEEKKKIKPMWAILDFKNKTYKVQHEDGSFYHSCETMYDRIEDEYISAGKIDGKEVFYDIGYNIYVLEDGKRRMIFDDLGMEKLTDDIPGYNCVGEECVLKLTKIKDDKYYFDVKVTLVEDGEWTQEYTLVIEDFRYKLKEK